jgi:hypothetical protein
MLEALEARRIVDRDSFALRLVTGKERYQFCRFCAKR